MPLRPEILVLAYECSPDRGSESGAGFAALCALSEAARCTVLVGSADRESLESWSRAHPERNVTVVAVDESPVGKWLYRLHHYAQFISYGLWMRRATPRLRGLAASGRFRVAWHTTYSPAWLPTPLRHLDTVATVWGPCNGGERVPRPLRSAMGRRSRGRDMIDNLATWLCLQLPATRRSHASVDLLVLAVPNPKIRHMRTAPTAIFSSTTLAAVPAVDAPAQREDCLYFTSPLRSQKGPLLAIAAAARNPQVRLVVAPPEPGPMRAEAERIVREHGAESRITFVDGLSRDEMLRRLCASKGFVHSAISDSASMALAEALVLGVPVVGLDILGTATLKDYIDRPEQMPLVAVHDPEQVIDDLGHRMVELLHNPDTPRTPLIDQRELQQRFIGYIDGACEIHGARKGRIRVGGSSQSPTRLLRDVVPPRRG